MKMRLGFAVAAHLQPEILLVDEVLAVGDAAFQRKSMNKITGISQQGRTVLFVSHNMAALQNICNRGVYLKDGKVAAIGSIADVISEYLDLSQEPEEGARSWATPESAPGDYRIRLKSVRVVSPDESTSELDFEKPVRIELEFWNLAAGKRTISVHLKDSKNQVVLASGNTPMASITPDPFYDRSFSEGVFKTTCEIPGHILNSGTYYLSVFVGGAFLKDTIVREADVLSFTLTDPHILEKEFTGEWLGVLRTKLDWETTQVG
jgi:lipopolysaccharide transport system ATP-binding protein